MKIRKLSIGTKFILLFAALALLLCAGVGALSYYMNYRQAVAEYGTRALNTARLAAYEVDGAAIPGYLAQGRDESYTDTEKWLERIKTTFDLAYLYVYVPCADRNDTVYVFDISAGDEVGAYGQLGEHTGEGNMYAVLRQVMTTGEAAEPQINRSQFGYLISAFVPIKTEGGATAAVMGVDIDMSVILGQARVETLRLSGLAAGIILLFVLLLLLLVNRQMVGPVNRLSAHMASFDREPDKLNLAPCQVNTGDEIELMADSFNRLAIELTQYVENLRSVTAEKERISTELNVARDIQASMLPSIFSFIPERPEFEIYATMRPARAVGGDFYDFFIIDGARLGFLIADVSGKGVPAALFMVIAKTLLRNHALAGKSPAEAFMAANAQLCENNGAGMFVTAFFGQVDLATGQVLFANAGHNPPLLYRRDQGWEWVKGKRGFVLAGMENVPYRDNELTLAPGDMLYLYTDGVTEALNPSQELFSEGRLLAALNGRAAARPSIRALLGQLQEELDAFAAGAEQADDVTMLALDWKGPQD